jgi:hypothetical protein
MELRYAMDILELKGMDSGVGGEEKPDRLHPSEIGMYPTP